MTKQAAGTKHAIPWALFWFGLISAGAWLPLFLAEGFSGLPVGRDKTVVSSRPLPGPGPSAIQRSSLDLAMLPATSAGLGISAAQPQVWPATSQLAASVGRVAPTPAAESGPYTAPLAPSQPLVSIQIAPVPDSVLLGGPLTLASIHEKAMVPAARTEQALRATARDRLQALPLHWRQDMSLLLQGANQVIPAQVVRLPAAHRRTPEEIPLAIKPQGPAETTVQPSSPRSRALVEAWTSRQEPLQAGQVRPVLVVLEPIASDQTVEPVAGVTDKLITERSGNQSSLNSSIDTSN